jgi:hypothetical protein
MLFISICSSAAPQVPKVLQVVEETKRIRHKAGKFTTLRPRPFSTPLGDKELYQYVRYDTATIPPKGPKIINLDDNKDKGKGKDYTPPNHIVVHLSKIDIPELRPRSAPPIHTGVGVLNERTGDGKVKESRRDHKEKEKKVKESSDKERKEMKKREKERATEKAKLRSKSSSPALTSHISPHPASTSQRPQARPHQLHQQFPSPSQLNNPAIYSTPPLPPRMPMYGPVPPSNRPSKYATYPAPYHTHRSSNQHRHETPVPPPPPPLSSTNLKLLDKLLGR